MLITESRCAMCQDYMFSLSSSVDPKLLKQANVNLVVIGNGSFNMIKSYRRTYFRPIHLLCLTIYILQRSSTLLSQSTLILRCAFTVRLA